MTDLPPPPTPGEEPPPYAAAGDAAWTPVDAVWSGGAVPPPPATPAQGYPFTAPGTNGKAVWSLVLGISSVVCCCLGLATGGAAIALGLAAQREMAVTGEQGAGLVRAGFITGGLGLALGLCFLVLVVTGNVDIHLSSGSVHL